MSERTQASKADLFARAVLSLGGTSLSVHGSGDGIKAGVIVAKTLYVVAAILERKEDPRFEGNKVIYRS